MNERIKELAEQTKKYALDAMIKITDKEQALKVYSETYDTKFAELIVRECATAFEAEVDTWKEMDPYQGSIKRQGTKAIKKHFGV